MHQLSELTVEPATIDERQTVWQLLQFYLYDFSGFAVPDDALGRVAADGTFAYPWFDKYWPPGSTHQVNLFRIHGDVAGFAMLNDWPPSGAPNDHAVAEFFVLQKYRRSGLGRQAARTLFRRHPGIWELGVVDYNKPALGFWRNVLSQEPVHDLSERPGDGRRWHGRIFGFRSVDE